MKLTTKILLLSSLFLVSSCTTVEFVRKDTSPVRQGILRHSPPSNDEKAQEYRKKVDEAAVGYCGGAYNITKEYQAMDEAKSSAGIGTGFGIGGSSSIFIGGSNRGSTMYNFVEFTCIKTN